MRFLHPIWRWQFIAVGALGLSFHGSLVAATEKAISNSPDSVDVDLAKLQSGGRIVFVSSGARSTGFRAIDNDRRTVFEFSNSDPRPTLIVKLNETKLIHRVSVVAGSEAGKVDVYLFNEPPSNPSSLDNTNPVASIVDLAVGREAVVDFAPQNVRYLALRWTLTKNSSGTLAVAEVCAFGNEVPDPGALALAAADPPPADPIQGPPIIITVSP